MLNGKTEFYHDSSSAEEFLHALCVQYTQTRKVREALSAIDRTLVPGSDIKRCSSLFALIAAMRIADRFYRERNRYKLVLLDNDTDIPFITGDQPVISLHATLDSGVPPEKLELFYPLSPERAMALLELETERATSPGTTEVQTYNELILRNSHAQVFSDSRRYLEELL